jgi:hypothetical protein
MMMSMSLKKEERKTVEDEESCIGVQINSSDENFLNALISLKSEEASLNEQKLHLKGLLLQLETKAKEQVDKKKRKIDRLTFEVSDLKSKCEKLSKMINSETGSECTQNGP